MIGRLARDSRYKRGGPVTRVNGNTCELLGTTQDLCFGLEGGPRVACRSMDVCKAEMTRMLRMGGAIDNVTQILRTICDITAILNTEYRAQ